MPLRDVSRLNRLMALPQARPEICSLRQFLSAEKIVDRDPESYSRALLATLRVQAACATSASWCSWSSHTPSGNARARSAAARNESGALRIGSAIPQIVVRVFVTCLSRPAAGQTGRVIDPATSVMEPAIRFGATDAPRGRNIATERQDPR
jgi:hypothetical protein